MPEFIMNGGDDDAFAALDPFTRGYIEAIFFTENEHGTTRETHNPETQSSLPGDVGFTDLAPEALTAIKDACAEFQESWRSLLERACESDRYSMHQAGVDFWFTRNGHGAGFWDRGLEDVGDELTKFTKPYGSSDAYLGDDGKVYLT